jgi:hypothetical protein
MAFTSRERTFRYPAGRSALYVGPSVDGDEQDRASGACKDPHPKERKESVSPTSDDVRRREEPVPTGPVPRPR